MSTRDAAPAGFARGAWVVAAGVLAAHLAANALGPYGIHRDEYLYLAMGRYLQLWRMDFPPLIALVARALLATGSESLVVLRLVPALAGTAVVLLGAAAARELGGDRRAQRLAALAVATSPLFLRTGTLLQPVVLDQLWWMAALVVLLRLAREPTPRRWLALGAALGLGLLTKFTIAVLALAITVAILATPLRRQLLGPWPWAGAALALSLGSPSLVGQVRLGWPFLAQLADLRATQLAHVTPLGHFGEQALMLGPDLLLAVPGLAGLVLAARWQEVRAAGIAVVVALGLLAWQRAKGYYAGPLYPLLFAAGACLLTAARPRTYARRWYAALVAILVVAGAALLPFGLPMLPPATMAAYADRLGLGATTRTNRGVQLALPQDYADMLGWRERVAAVAAAVRALPPTEQAQVVIGAANYGQAGALDFHGPRLGLSRAVCACGSYWFFGPGDRPGAVLVRLGHGVDDVRGLYDSVEVVARVHDQWAVPEERDVPVAVARRPRRTLQAVWPELAGRN